MNTGKPCGGEFVQGSSIDGGLINPDTPLSRRSAILAGFLTVAASDFCCMYRKWSRIIFNLKHTSLRNINFIGAYWRSDSENSRSGRIADSRATVFIRIG